MTDALGTMARPPAAGPPQTREHPAPDAAIGVALKLSKRAMEISSLDELFFFLANDTRTLVEFDRCFLLVHMGGDSRFAAVNNQPVVEGKSAFKEEWNKLAQGLASYDKVIFSSHKQLEEGLKDMDESGKVADAVSSYMKFSGCTYFLCLPLVHATRPVGHLVFEFVDAARPKKAILEILVGIAPSLATALFEQWARSTNPTVWDALTGNTPQPTTVVGKASRRLATALVCAAALTSVLFFFPTTFTVGGEVEIVPQKSRMAFSNLDAMIEKVSVKEGESVKKGQTLATLDPTEIDFRIAKCQREAEILAQEISVQAAEAYKDQAAWAKKKVAELKRQSMLEEVAYLKWKRGFLNIVSPVDGVVMTRNVESLKGKSLKTGEAFCEMAVPNEFCAEVRVSEERIGYVKVGQKVIIYLNTDPWRGYELHVSEIVPSAKMMPRAGNVFAVRADFPSPPAYLRLGMKGMGKIYTKSANVWFIVSQRLRTRWNEFALSW